MITTDDIKKLRDRTGISVMQCKKALEEAKGDGEKALILLRKKGAAVAAKKSDRALGAGAVAAYVHGNGQIGAMAELSSETDFVSKNDEFRALAYDIAMQVAASNPPYLKAEDIPEETKAKAREVFAKEAEGKPEAMRQKITEGKLSAYFSGKILLEQPFIKNPEMKVKDLIEAGIQKFGEKIEIARFARFSVSEK